MITRFNDVEWKEFFIEEIAAINSGRDIYEAERFAGDFPYISSKSVNNGVAHFVGNLNDTLESECVSVNRNGSVGYAFYHPYKALYSNDCRKLRLKRKSGEIALFFAFSVTMQREKYNYGYKMGTARLKRQKIMLPVDRVGVPDYAFIEKVVKELEFAQTENFIEYARQEYLGTKTQEIVPLNKKEWRTFAVGDLFELKTGKGKGANHLSKDPYGISYLSATNRNNAVSDFVVPVPRLVQKGNCIAFICNGEGSMGYAVYKSEDFIATCDITLGYADFLNKYTGVFITTVADKVRGKYNYNYKRSPARLEKELLQLPVDENGAPDWAYMEVYTRKLFERVCLDFGRRKGLIV